MDLLPTPEQDEIVASVRAVLADRHTLGEPLDDSLWHAAVEQGWFTLGLPESLGGVGYTLVEEALLFRELGRAAAPGPFLATALTAHVAAHAGADDLVAAIASGEVRAAIAEPAPDGAWYALDLPGAAVVLLVDGAEVSVVDASDVEADPAPGIDTLVPLAIGRVRDGATPRAVVADARAFELTATVLTAAVLAGIADAVTQQSVEYAKDRQQFGQPIGGFQAVKHRCADMATRAEVAGTQVTYAALAVADGLAEAGFHAHAARVVAGRAAVDNAQTNVQNHGGIGFTWEHTAHRYVTRARVVASTCGTTASHQAALLAEPAPA